MGTLNVAVTAARRNKLAKMLKDLRKMEKTISKMFLDNQIFDSIDTLVERVQYSVVWSDHVLAEKAAERAMMKRIKAQKLKARAKK